MDENRNEIEGNQVVEVCVLNFHGLGLLEQFGVTIRGIGYLFFSLPGTYFTGDGALRDEVGIE
jgi:acetyl-CoA synthetase